MNSDKNFFKKRPKLTLDIFSPKSKKEDEDKNLIKPEKISYLFNDNNKKNYFKNKNLNKIQNNGIKLLSVVLFLILILGIFYFFDYQKNIALHNLKNQNVKLGNEGAFNEFLKNLGLDEKDFENNKSISSKLISFLPLFKENLFLTVSILPNLYDLFFKFNGVLNDFPLIISQKIEGKVLRNNIVEISNSLNSLKSFFLKSSDLKSALNEGDYFYLYDNLNRFSNFLDALIKILDEDKKQHFLVLFLNNSEMRPGGGFLGSYADIEIYNWEIKSIKVLDINDPDREFNQKIIPPYALQSKVYSWKAADANWFLDFASSSSKIISFLENSDFYKKDDVKFLGVLAITPQVAKDLLEILGPIEVQKNLVLNKDNFLIQLQKIIEENRENKEQNPKIILSEFLNKILEKTNSLTENQKNNILKKFLNWLDYQNIAFYFKDAKLQSFFDYYELTPRMTQLTNDFWGDYLAVVDANALSGKSDIFIKKIVNLEIQISNNGTLNNSLEVIRKNEVLADYSWWYKRQNEDYLSIYVPKGAQILKATGGESKKIIPKANYLKEGFVFDDYLNYEKTINRIDSFPQIDFYDFGDKNIFSTWLKTLPGTTNKFKLEYIRKLPLEPQNNKKFTFILDKQISDGGEYNIKIQAPIGFYFKENNLSVFEYHTKEFKSPLIIELTLISD
jgi:hypothetical protein